MFPAGLTTRGYGGPTDLPGMVAVHDVRVDAEGDEDYTSVEDMATSYEHLQRCDPATDIVIVEDAGSEIVGYGRTTWDDVSEGYRAYWVVVEAGATRPDLEEAIFNRVESRAGQIAADHDVPERMLQAWGLEGGPRSRRLVERGYQAFMYAATLVRPTLDDIPDRPLPPGVEVRPVEKSHRRAIWEAENEAFRDHRGYTEQTEVDWESWLEGPHRDESLWQIAWAGDRVVGQVRSFIDPAENQRFDRRRGWTEDISTARDWRGRGIAASLICSSLEMLRGRDMTEAALGVDTENPTGALRLYESLGFRRVRMYADYQRSF